VDGAADGGGVGGFDAKTAWFYARFDPPHTYLRVRYRTGLARASGSGSFPEDLVGALPRYAARFSALSHQGLPFRAIWVDSAGKDEGQRVDRNTARRGVRRTGEGETVRSVPQGGVQTEDGEVVGRHQLKSIAVHRKRRGHGDAGAELERDIFRDVQEEKEARAVDRPGEIPVDDTGNAYPVPAERGAPELDDIAVPRSGLRELLGIDVEMVGADDAVEAAGRDVVSDRP
jgi:hypothetical protein